MKENRVLESYLEFLDLLTLQLESGDLFLTFDDSNMMIYHLRKFSRLLLKAQDSVRSGNHSPLLSKKTNQIYIKLYDLGLHSSQGSSDHLNKETIKDARSSVFNVRKPD